MVGFSADSLMPLAVFPLAALERSAAWFLLFFLRSREEVNLASSLSVRTIGSASQLKKAC